LDDEEDVRSHQEDDLDGDEEFSERGPSGKRRSLGDGDRSQEKRRKLDDVSHHSTLYRFIKM
jgi:cell division control protein 45